MHRSKLVYIIGSIAIGIIAVLAVLLGLVAGGVIGTYPEQLIISSGSASKPYDGTELYNDKCEIVDGELKEGHTIEFKTYVKVIDAGEQLNYVSATIYDARGVDVTKDYDIVYHPGLLSVVARQITVRTESAIKKYDGTALACDNYNVVYSDLLPGHEIEVEVTGSMTGVGVDNNYFQAKVYDEVGKDVTTNYHIVPEYGKLTIEARKITVRSESLKKVVDGEPLLGYDPEDPDYGWKIVSTQGPLEGHQVKVVVTGSVLGGVVGEAPNTIAEVLVVDEDGKDVSSNYDIKCEEGQLVVVSEDDLSGGEEGGTGNGPTSEKDGKESLEELLEELGLEDMVNGDIGLPDGIMGGEEIIVAKIYSSHTGTQYLKNLSYGDYNFQSWGVDVPNYEFNKFIEDTDQNIDSIVDGQKYSMSYLGGILNLEAEEKSELMRIQSLCDMYFLPYYTSTELNDYTVQLSDVYYTGNTEEEYSLYFFPNDGDGVGALASVVDYPKAVKTLESAYYAHVKNTYLQIPDTTKVFFDDLIANKKFDKTSDNIVETVAAYIQSAAKYNLQYDRSLDREDDIAVSFLKDYKEGVCQHYATAATMLYRALGIPARYTTGLVADTKSNETVEVSQMKMHAWVEVYYKGIGWVPVEVTGSMYGGGTVGGTPTDDYPGEQPGEGQPETSVIRVHPQELVMKYDGTTLVPPESAVITGDEQFRKLLSEGYTYEAVVTGSQTEIGKSESIIDPESFKFYDKDNKDVTKEYDFVFLPGVLHVYESELFVSTNDIEQEYDGSVLKSDGEYSITGEMLAGHRIERADFDSAQMLVGAKANDVNFLIFDENGDDVTDYYYIRKQLGMLTVYARTIIIRAQDKDWDDSNLPEGESKLTHEEYTIVSGELVEGHTVEVTFDPDSYLTINEYGTMSNSIINVTITDANGKVVYRPTTQAGKGEDNYIVEILPGTLTYYP